MRCYKPRGAFAAYFLIKAFSEVPFILWKLTGWGSGIF
jgi:hypothetical protein